MDSSCSPRGAWRDFEELLFHGLSFPQGSIRQQIPNMNTYNLKLKGP